MISILLILAAAALVFAAGYFVGSKNPAASVVAKLKAKLEDRL